MFSVPIIQPGKLSSVFLVSILSTASFAQFAQASPANNGDVQLIAAGFPGSDASNSRSPEKPKLNGDPDASNVDQLVEMLGLKDIIQKLKAKSNNEIETVILQHKIMRAIQYAALELEETLANIDGDLATTNMQYSYFSAKHDKALALNNAATFISSGTLGLMDSATSIHMAPPPTSDVLGLLGNATAIGIPLLGLLPPKYKVKQSNAPEGNALAPIFGKKPPAPEYDPIIWKYLETIPANSKEKLTRRQILLRDWQKLRGVKAGEGKADASLEELIEIKMAKRVSLGTLKTRSEMLVDLRALVQQMYKDISDLNTSIMEFD